MQQDREGRARVEGARDRLRLAARVSSAASAGVWISQAADLLAMAPQTNIGSSTPIDVGGGNIQSDLRRKVINDAAASLSAAREEPRPQRRPGLRRAVRHASNLGATEALEKNVIDVMAPTLPRAAEQGRRHEDGAEGHRPAHEGRGDHRTSTCPSGRRSSTTLIDPNLIVLFMSIGTLGLVVELWNPGLIFPGTVGAISLHPRRSSASQVLPISAAGLAADAARRSGSSPQRRSSRPTARSPSAGAVSLRARRDAALRARRRTRTRSRCPP